MIVISMYDGGYSFAVSIAGIRLYSGSIYNDVVKITNSPLSERDNLIKKFFKKYNKEFSNIYWCEDGAIIYNGKNLE